MMVCSKNKKNHRKDPRPPFADPLPPNLKIFSAWIPFVGRLNLRQEISELLQKKSAQTDLPRLRKGLKTEKIIPEGWKPSNWL